jgi:hypothetical protein
MLCKKRIQINHLYCGLYFVAKYDKTEVHRKAVCSILTLEKISLPVAYILLHFAVK